MAKSRIRMMLFRALNVLNIALTVAVFFKVGGLEGVKSEEVVTATEMAYPDAQKDILISDVVSDDGIKIEKTGTTANRIQREFEDYLSYVDMNFMTSDWEIGVDYDKESIWMTYIKFPHTLSDARYYLDNQQFKAQWIAFTNDTFQKTQDYLKELRVLGYTGSFKMVVIDPTGTIIYMATDGAWGDEITNTKGITTRGI